MTPDDIKLGRVGHYSWENACQTARITHVWENSDPLLVNVAGETHEGDHFSRRTVFVGPREGTDAEFHLNQECPWKR